MEWFRSNVTSGLGAEGGRTLWFGVHGTVMILPLAFARRSIAMTRQSVSKSVLLLAIAAAAQAALAVDPLPAARKYDWSYTGVPGGIPNVTKICATFAATATAAQINAAIGACSNGVVLLNAGTYASLGGTINVNKSGVVLRGAGADVTILRGGAGMVGMTFSGYNSTQRATNRVTSGGAKGTFTATMTSATGVAVGNVIWMERTDAAYVYADQQGAYDASKYANITAQQNVITGVNGTTITVRNPWVTDFTAANTGNLRAYSGAWLNHVGVENLKLDYQGNSGTGIYIQGCDSCWIKGIDSYNLQGYQVSILGSVNLEIRDSFIHGTPGISPNQSGISVYGNNSSSFGAGSANVKIENNIFWNTFPQVELNNGSMGVYAGYNFFYGTPSVPPYTVSWSMNTHGGGDMSELWEGNIGEMVGSDGRHGGDVASTIFRNFLVAVNRNDTSTANDSSGAATKLKRMDYFASYIGNVMGNSLATSPVYERDPVAGCSAPAIYEFGFPNIGNCSLTSDSGNLPQPAGWTYPDANVKSTAFRWGNYDYFHKSVQWNSAEVPTVDTYGGGYYAVPVPADHVLPASYVYTARPGWFTAGVPWPPIGPDVAGGTASFGDTSGQVNDIPAELCWNSRNLGGGGTFNAAVCYPLSTSAGPPPPPPPAPGLAAPANIRVTP
jgi:hypothetical protein